MKKVLLLVALATLIAAPAFAVIKGSAHDFSQETWGVNATGVSNSASNEICIYCHTPHAADTSIAGAPLWNHEQTANTSYKTYDSLTFDASKTTGTAGQPGATSLLCLSCHDSSVALDAFGGATGTTSLLIAARADIGADFAVTGGTTNDLSNDHPIGFTYDSTLVSADGGLNPVTTNLTSLGNKSIDAAMLFGGKVECASCHDVHNDAGNSYLLLVDNKGSDLCLVCHKK